MSGMEYGIRFTGDARQLVGETKAVQSALDGVSVAAQRNQSHAQQIGTVYGSVSESMAKSRSEMDRLSKSSDALSHSLSLVKSGLAGLSVAALGSQVMDAATAMDRFNSSIAIATGSAANAAAEYDHVRQLSQRLGLEVSGTAAAYASFSAAARGSALEGAKARDVFDSVAGVAAKMGLNGEQSSGVFLALSQMMSKGVVSAEEFRQQLGERLPIATEAGARAMKVTTAEFVNLLNSGKLLSEDFLPKFAVALNEMGGGNGPVNTLQASLNRLSNNWTEIKLNLAESAPLQGASNALAALTSHTGLLSAGLAGATAAGTAYGALKIGSMAMEAISGLMAKNAALAAERAATLAAAEAEVIRTAAVVAGTRVNAAMGGSYAAHTAAVEAHTAALAAQTTAQAASAASAGVARGALALLGGPIGAITLVLGIGAAAWVLWGRSARDAAAEASKAVADSEARASRLGLSIKQTLSEDLKNALAERDRLKNTGASGAEIKAADDKAWALNARLEEIAIREKNLAAAQASASAATSEWDKLFQTRVEKKRDAIAKLDAEYQKETQRFVGNEEAQLRLAREYQAKRAEIDRQFATKGASATESELKRYQQLTDAENKHHAVLLARISDTDKLSESEKKLAEFDATSLKSSDRKIEAARLEARAAIERNITLEREQQLREASAKAGEQVMSAAAAELKAANSVRDALINKTAAREKEHVAELRAQADELDSAAAAYQLAASQQAASDGVTALSAAYAKLAEDIQKAASDKRQTADVLAQTEALRQQKDQAQSFVDTWKQVDQTAHDAFVNIMNGGKDVFTRLTDTLKNTLWDLLYQMTVKQWVFNITAAVTGTSSGAMSTAAGMLGGSGGGGMMGYASAGQSLYGLYSGSTAATRGGTISSLGGALGSTTLSAFGTGMGLTTAEAAAASGAYSAAGMSSVGSSLSAGATFAQAVPYIGGALAIMGLLSSGMFSGGGGKNYHNGDSNAVYNADGTLRSNTTTTFRSAGSDAAVQQMHDQYSSIINLLGAQAVVTNFKFQSAYADSVGQRYTLTGGAGSSQFGVGIAQQTDAAVQLSAARAVFAAVQGSDLPAYLKKAFDGLTPASATLDQINSAYAFAQGLKAIRDQLTETRTPLEIARTGMADLGKQLKTTAETYQADYLAAVNSGLDQPTLAKWQSFGALIKQVTDLEAQRVQAEQQASQAARDHIKALQDQATADFRAAQSSTDALRAFATSVRDLQRTLWLGAQSPLSGTGSVMFTRAQFDSVNAAAAAGNTAAQGGLASAATQYLDAYKSQARTSLDYAREFANVQQALADTAMVTDQTVTVADKQLEELKKVNTWLAAIDTKNGTQNQSLSYLLQASIASSEAARVAAVAQAMVDATNGIKAAVGVYGGTFDANKLTTAQDAATGTASLSYVDGYRTTNASVSRTASVTAPTTTIDQVAKAQADAEAAAAAARVKAKADALTALNTAKAQAYVAPQYIGPYYTSLVRQMPWLDVSHQLPVIDAAIAASSKRIADAQAYYDSLPAFSVGSSYVPHDMTANIHAGEKIIDPQSSAILNRYGIKVQGAGNDALVEEVRALRAELSGLHAELAGLRSENQAGQIAIASNTQDSKNFMQRWDKNGIPPTRVAA
ncbi:MAG: tape measure protein [Gallionella sp.]|nr:tape measure protein [Gallionella sp.]